VLSYTGVKLGPS